MRGKSKVSKNLPVAETILAHASSFSDFMVTEYSHYFICPHEIIINRLFHYQRQICLTISQWSGPQLLNTPRHALDLEFIMCPENSHQCGGSNLASLLWKELANCGTLEARCAILDYRVGGFISGFWFFGHMGCECSAQWLRLAPSRIFFETCLSWQ